jgi:hypothetical protein
MDIVDMGDFSIDAGATEANPSSNPSSKPVVNAPPLIPPTAPKLKQDVAYVGKEMKKIAQGKTPEAIKTHQEHVLMLSRYGTSDRFGDYLETMSFDLSTKNLHKKSVQDLEETLERVRTTVANKTISDVWGDSILGALQMGENVVTMTSMGETVRIQGLSEMLKDDECFMDLLEELRLENQNLSYVSPYVRIGYTVLTAGARCHGMNTLMAKHKAKKEVEANNPIAQAVNNNDKKEAQANTNPTIVSLDD